MLSGTSEGEEDSEECSSYKTMTNQFKSALDEFREKWQQELRLESTTEDKFKDDTNDENYDDANETEDRETLLLNSNENDIDNEEKRAEYLFRQGVDYERRGKVYDALQYYRRAVQIIPDIEFRIYESTKNHIRKNQMNSIKEEKIHSDYNDDCTNSSDEEDLSNVDLYARFQNALLKEDQLIYRSGSDTSNIKAEIHISDLPMEIILYILRWVVSSHLDVRSLEQCAATCRGLYLCARDEEIWKLVCLKVWGVNTGNLSSFPYSSWRQMFIERHRILFNGCYISKTSYIRYGENSFQDTFYRPVQLIEYYRFVRFFPDGTVIMMTSADDPAQTVSKLKNLNQLRPEALKGHYRLHGDIVIIMLKRNTKIQSNNKRRTNNIIDIEIATPQTFYIELRITGSPKRRFCQLQWKHYSSIQIRNKREISTDFELTAAKFPPFWFSRVKSYHLESDSPLQ